MSNHQCVRFTKYLLVNKLEIITVLTQSLASYKYITDYADQYGMDCIEVAVSQMLFFALCIQDELAISREMVQLLPLKIRRIEMSQ